MPLAFNPLPGSLSTSVKQTASPDSISEVASAERSILRQENRRAALARRKKLGLLSLLSGAETGLPELLGG